MYALQQYSIEWTREWADWTLSLFAIKTKASSKHRRCNKSEQKKTVLAFLSPG